MAARSTRSWAWTTSWERFAPTIVRCESLCSYFQTKHTTGLPGILEFLVEPAQWCSCETAVADETRRVRQRSESRTVATRDRSWLEQLFMGEITKTIKCRGCGGVGLAITLGQSIKRTVFRASRGHQRAIFPTILHQGDDEGRGTQRWLQIRLQPLQEAWRCHLQVESQSQEQLCRYYPTSWWSNWRGSSSMRRRTKSRN